MSERGRLRYVVSILVLVASLIGGFSTYRQYEASLHEKKQLLYAQVRSLSSLIEAVARFDRGTFRQREKAAAATLSQLFDAFADRIDFETAQEIQFVRDTGTSTEIFLRYFGRNKNQNVIIPHAKFLPEPVRLAAAGESGSGYYTGLHGEDILAAFTYIAPLHIGLVVDVDLWSLRKPYLISGAFSALFAAGVLIIAAWAIVRLTNPIIERVREKEVLNTTIVETAHDALVILDGTGVIRQANPATQSVFGWKPQTLTGRYFSVLFPPEAAVNGELTVFIRDPKTELLELNEATGKNRNGQLFPVRISASKKEYGTGRWCTLTIQDLTHIRKAELTIRELSRRLIETQDLEREDLSRELHDGLGSTLVGMKLQVQSLLGSTAGPDDKLRRQVLENFDDVIEQTRNISNLLSPFALRHLSIGQALRKLADFYTSDRHGVRVEAQIGVTEALFGTSATLQIYRIAQEAIQNAVKHAHARNIRIIFAKDGARTVLSISDDGRGFDPGELAAGQGLQIMKERAVIIPAELTIRSEPNGGTEVQLVIH